MGTRQAAIYCRVSTDGQEDNASLATQEAACRAYASERGYSVAEAYTDVHSGYELWERPKLTILREGMRRGEFDAIICHALDRLSRKQVHTAILTDECDRARVALLFVTEEFEKSAIGEFLRSAKAFAAELEREKFKERSQRGKRARVESGQLMPGPRPLYGYQFRDAERTGYDHDPTTAPIVRRIFAAAADGVPTRRIALTLMAEGVPSPGGVVTWHHRTVLNILGNRAYTGEAAGLRWQVTRAGGKQTKTTRPTEQQIPLPAGVVPPLVDLRTFEAVQERLRRNKEAASRNNGDPKAALLRGGIAKCGICGCNMRVAHRPSRGRSMPLYVCNRGATSMDCARPSISAKNLDAEVWGSLAAFLQRRDVVQFYRDQFERDDGLADDLATVERMLADLDRKRANLTRSLALFDNQEDAAPVAAEIAQLGKRRAGIVTERDGLLARQAQQVASMETLRSIEEWCRVVAENLPHLDYDQRRTVLEDLGVCVRVFPRGETRRWAFDGNAARVIAGSTST